MRVDDLLPDIIVMIIIASSLVVLGGIGGVSVDVATVTGSFYALFILFLVEGFVPIVPKKVMKTLAEASILAFLPAFLLFFYAGYTMGRSIRTTAVLASFFASLSVGIVIAILVFITLNVITKLR